MCYSSTISGLSLSLSFSLSLSLSVQIICLCLPVPLNACRGYAMNENILRLQRLNAWEKEI